MRKFLSFMLSMIALCGCAHALTQDEKDAFLEVHALSKTETMVLFSIVLDGDNELPVALVSRENQEWETYYRERGVWRKSAATARGLNSYDVYLIWDYRAKRRLVFFMEPVWEVVATDNPDDKITICTPPDLQNDNVELRWNWRHPFRVERPETLEYAKVDFAPFQESNLRLNPLDGFVFPKKINDSIFEKQSGEIIGEFDFNGDGQPEYIVNCMGDGSTCIFTRDAKGKLISSDSFDGNLFLAEKKNGYYQLIDERDCSAELHAFNGERYVRIRQEITDFRLMENRVSEKPKKGSSYLDAEEVTGTPYPSDALFQAAYAKGGEAAFRAVASRLERALRLAIPMPFVVQKTIVCVFASESMFIVEGHLTQPEAFRFLIILCAEKPSDDAFSLAGTPYFIREAYHEKMPASYREALQRAVRSCLLKEGAQ